MSIFDEFLSPYFESDIELRDIVADIIGTAKAVFVVALHEQTKDLCRKGKNNVKSTYKFSPITY